VAALLLGSFATVALGHSVETVTGLVDCNGYYVVTVTGEVFDNTALVVEIDGTQVSNATTGQTGDGHGVYTVEGSGGSAGQAIRAFPADRPDRGADGVLAFIEQPLSQDTCPTDEPLPDTSMTP